MIAPYKNLIKAISARDKPFFIIISLLILISIPITVFGVFQVRDNRALARHQDCFDLNGDFIVTIKDIDLIVDHFGSVAGSSNYVAAYDLNHTGNIDVSDIGIEVSHIDEKCLPVITFSASTTSITRGGSVRLSWNIRYSNSRSISPGIGSVGSSGSIRVFPGSTTAYRLTARNRWGSRQAQKTITVSTVTSGGGGSTSSIILQAIKFKISVPYLIGKLKIPVIIKGRTKEIEVSGGKKEYTIGVKKEKFKVGDKLTIIIGGNKILTKKFTFTPKKNKPVVNVGDLFLGDVTGDNKIDGSDKATLLDSIANQTDIGDVNIDGVANSLDWAILLVNFGRKGSL